MQLDIVLPKNRIYTGFFVLTDDAGTLLLAGRARGKADNGRAAREGNAERCSTLPFGDTPLGEYCPAQVTVTHNSRLGNSWIPIVGKSGDALTAEENGRYGIGIHAGRTNTNGKLVTTHGCVRLDTIDYDRLVAVISGRFVNVTISERWGD